MTVLDAATGFPAFGRRRETLDDLRAQLVDHEDFAGSVTRAAIWGDFEKAVALIDGAALLHAVWLGGSFVSAKMDPGDIDAVFLINARDFRKRSDDDRKIVQSFTDLQPDALGRPVRSHGLRVDSYILFWTPAQTKGAAPAYFQDRGYWDDFWCRERGGKPKGSAFTWEDAFPRRGYVEVIINEFQR